MLYIFMEKVFLERFYAKILNNNKFVKLWIKKWKVLAAVELKKVGSFNKIVKNKQRILKLKLKLIKPNVILI